MEYAIEAEGLRKRFGATQALDGVDLAARRGSVLGVLGPNGAGKTTAVRILATLIEADAGTARVAGHDVAREPGRVREPIGLTGQYASVDELLTGEQNLVMIGQLLDLSGRAGPRPGQGAARLVRPRRGRQPPRQDLLRRHAPPARPGREPRRPPVGDLPRRADDRPGPVQARGHVGRRAQPRARRLDRPAHHPVPRRGRRAGRRDHRDRPRARDRARHAGGPQAGRRRPDADGPARRRRRASTRRRRSSASSPARGPRSQAAAPSARPSPATRCSPTPSRGSPPPASP